MLVNIDYTFKKHAFQIYDHAQKPQKYKDSKKTNKADLVANLI